MPLFLMLRDYYLYYAFVMSIRRFLVIALLFAFMPAWGQASFDKWMNEAGVPAEDQPAVQQQIERLIKRSQNDGAASEQNLRKMFRRVQRSILKRYVPYTDFSAMFTEGKFDCLTATTLYAHLLESLSYRFDVIETNYHIFLLVHTGEGEVMLETTDPVGGFVTDAGTIAARTGDYQRNELKPNGAGYSYPYQCNLFQRVSTEQLSGLLQFNRAVKAYNQGDWISCAASLAKAQERYDNPRIRELCHILMRTLLERKEINTDMRNECLSRLQPLLVTGPVFSSLD
jgi:hypothetical protein